jgi:hypothetical protein
LPQINSDLEEGINVGVHLREKTDLPKPRISNRQLPVDSGTLLRDPSGATELFAETFRIKGSTAASGGMTKSINYHLTKDCLMIF